MGRRGQLQFAQAQRGWYGGRERGDWTQQMDLTNTERGRLWPTTDAGRSRFRDREKMLSDSERASSITVPVCLSAGWLWEKRESEGRQKRVPQEGDFKIKAGKDRNKKEREEEYTFPLIEGVFSCWVHECSILPSFSQTSLLPFPIKKSSLFPLTSSLHCVSNDLSVLPSLLHGQLNVRPIGQGVNGAAARALQLNNVWQGTNSTDRGETPTKPLQRSEESLGN